MNHEFYELLHSQGWATLSAQIAQRIQDLRMRLDSPVITDYQQSRILAEINALTYVLSIPTKPDSPKHKTKESM